LFFEEVKMKLYNQQLYVSCTRSARKKQGEKYGSIR